jgi:hypothetical protein
MVLLQRFIFNHHPSAMKKFISFLSLSLSFGLSVYAQKPEALLQKWATLNAVEKAWLHFDRDEYAAGQMAWFKAYLSSDYLPDTISTNLYVQLLNKNRTIITEAVLPIVLGGSNGQLDLPDTLSAGMYTIRAFTPAMMAQAPDFIFKKGLYIHGKTKNETTVQENKLHLHFFPEGGNFVAGSNNAVAFKITDSEGLPVTSAGSIKNSKGETVISFSPVHDGMGLVELLPVAGEKYYAVADKAPGEKFPLPDVAAKGIIFTVLPHPQGNYFEIQQPADDPVFKAAYAIGQMQNHPVFKLEFGNTKEPQQGIINTTKLRSGILQITVFNKEGMPLSERLCFINNKEYLQPVTVAMDTISFDARGRNRFSFLLSDTVQASLSVSITDAAYEQYAQRPENILTGLLLTSDIKGYVHNPSWYFSADNDSVKAAVDLLMMTNGWRRFIWKELAAANKPVPLPSAYITLAGRATLKGTNRPFDSKALLLMINGAGAKKGRSTHMLQTDKDGKFIIDSLVFFDRNRLLFTDIRGKKSQYIDVQLTGDSLQRLYAVKEFVPVPDTKAPSLLLSRWKEDYDAILKANGLMLEGVTVKAQKKTPLQLLDDRYTSGMFSGEATKAIDLVTTDEASPYNNIFDYLQGRVNGLQINTDGAEYGVYYRQGPSVSSMGNIPMTIFLDEVETDISVLAALPANQVALVKIYNTFAGAWGNAPGGVLSIYSKKGADYVSGTSFANLSFYNGYSVIKEFYAPDYKMPAPADKPDNRITLDWRPNIFVNNINPRIPVSFYNNDRTKAFKVVMEGMTSTGKLIWLEKVVKP